MHNEQSKTVHRPSVCSGRISGSQAAQIRYQNPLFFKVLNLNLLHNNVMWHRFPTTCQLVPRYLKHNKISLPHRNAIKYQYNIKLHSLDKKGNNFQTTLQLIVHNFIVI
jgi:hypothetical protein